MLRLDSSHQKLIQIPLWSCAVSSFIVTIGYDSAIPEAGVCSGVSSARITCSIVLSGCATLSDERTTVMKGKL